MFSLTRPATGPGEVSSGPRWVALLGLLGRTTLLDRYGTTDPAPLGAPAENIAQEIEAGRVRIALGKARVIEGEHNERSCLDPLARSGSAGACDEGLLVQGASADRSC